MPDSEILAASFKLSDGQEMVARQQGFDNWQALKSGLSTTSLKVKSSPSKATIVSAEPQLFVTDIKRSCEFFREKLGSTLVFSYGRPPYCAQVDRDAARLNLRCVERPVIESAVRDQEELLSVSITVATGDEVKLLFLDTGTVLLRAATIRSRTECSSLYKLLRNGMLAILGIRAHAPSR